MAITDWERVIITQNAIFLENLGYARTENRYSIKYTLNDICISIIYPPNSDESEVNICFISKNKVYNVGWIAFVSNNRKECTEKIINVKELLMYIENHYSQIVDYRFCENCNRLIDNYVVEHQDKYEEAIQKFLSEN
ncbi:MAG: hypothetical protein E7258_04200 [Lachnospiraceae bacterium]|nr:hypothetical protein [Lachnospiraceae bacterium]